MSNELEPPPFSEIARRGRQRERRRRTVLGGTAVVLLVVVGVIGWQALDRGETRVLIPADRTTTTSIGQIVGAGGRTCRDVERDAASGTTTIPAPPPNVLTPDSTDEEVAAWTIANSRDGSDFRVDADDDQTHASIVTGAGATRRTLYTAPPEARITAIERLPDHLYFVLAGADGKSSLRRIDLVDNSPGGPDSVVLPEVRTRFFTVSPDETKVAWVEEDGPMQLVIASLPDDERRSMPWGTDSVGDNFGWDETSTHLWIQLDRAPRVIDCRTGAEADPLSDLAPGSHFLETDGWIDIGWIRYDATSLDGALRFDVGGKVLGTFNYAGDEVVAVLPFTSSGDVAVLVDPTTGRSLGTTARPANVGFGTTPDFIFGGRQWVVDG